MTAGPTVRVAEDADPPAPDRALPIWSALAATLTLVIGADVSNVRVLTLPLR